MLVKKVFNYDIDNVYNINEGAVIEAMEKSLDEYVDTCRCGVCLEDIYALSLNSIPAKYIQNYFSARDPERLVDIELVENTVRKSIEQVTRHPHHE